MKQLLFLLPFFLFVFVHSVSAQGHEEEEVMYSVEAAPEPELREEFNEDGTFRRYEGDRLQATGFHKKGQLEGELKEYDYSGKVVGIKHYKNGKLHGVCTSNLTGSKYLKEYDNGEQIGYEEKYSPSGQLVEREGPFFAGRKTEHQHTYFESTYDTRNGSYQCQFDTISFRANETPIVRRWILRKNEAGEVLDTFLMGECGFVDYREESYSIYSVEQLRMEYAYRNETFDYRSFDTKKEIRIFDKKGYAYLVTTPQYWVTHWESKAIMDSVINVPPGGSYYHFRFDKEGKPVFRSKRENVPDLSTTRWTFEYLKNGSAFYSISSLNYKPEKVWSINDSINEVIQKGAFTDYYGTVYITQSTGNIDTSFSKAIYPHRYKKDIAPGKYYFLMSTEGFRLEWITVDTKGITYFNASQKNPTTFSTTYRLRAIFQHDSLYHMFSGLRAYTIPCQLLKTKQGLYSIDFICSDYDDYYSLEQLLLLTANDSIQKFRSILLTEKQYQEALTRKKISEMPKGVFIDCMKELEPIRLAERAARDGFEVEIREEIRRKTRQLAQIVYNKGYNPYFSEDEFGKLMESYGWSQEDRNKYKKILRP